MDNKRLSENDITGTAQAADGTPLRIMPLGDSITAGYTDNPEGE